MKHRRHCALQLPSPLQPCSMPLASRPASVQSPCSQQHGQPGVLYKWSALRHKTDRDTRLIDTQRAAALRFCTLACRIRDSLTILQRRQDNLASWVPLRAQRDSRDSSVAINELARISFILTYTVQEPIAVVQSTHTDILAKWTSFPAPLVQLTTSVSGHLDVTIYGTGPRGQLARLKSRMPYVQEHDLARAAGARP